MPTFEELVTRVAVTWDADTKRLYDRVCEHYRASPDGMTLSSEDVDELGGLPD